MRPAKLSDVLNNNIAKLNEVYLDGVPASDPSDPASVRVYPDPTNGTSYYVVKIDDVLKTEEWDAADIREAGYVGSLRFRLTIPITAKLLSVTVRPVDASTLVCYNTCSVQCGNGYSYSASCPSGQRCDCSVDCPNRTGSYNCVACGK